MDCFKESFSKSTEYPNNLLSIDDCCYNVEEYHHRLAEARESSRLFGYEGDALVDCLELEDKNSEFSSMEVRTDIEMRIQLRMPNSGTKDPLCRYIFIHAPSSRSKLKVTRLMLTTIFTYHQVMPVFLDFIFSFGEQEYPKDFHFSSFWSDDRFSGARKIEPLPDLGRSDQHFQLCYNLKSVEQKKIPEGSKEWPWTIRQTAVYHSFDLETGRSVWIMVKGKRSMRHRFKKATESAHCELTACSTTQEALAASLAAHQILCEWSRERWARYVSFLEQELQNITRQAVAVPIDRPTPAPKDFRPLTRFKTTQISPLARRSTFSAPVRALSSKVGRAFTLIDPRPAATSNNFELDEKEEEKEDDHVFTFSVLQGISSIKEKANETLLVIKNNTSIISELKGYYQCLPRAQQFPVALKAGAKNTVRRFTSRTMSTIHDLKLQQSRVETLIKLLDDRKEIMFGIMEYKNMEANNVLTMKSQRSANKMERISENMREIAAKTEQETVFMRIITIVTLFFLPGTFISTLMSTDILRFPPAAQPGASTRIFSLEALKYYLGITLPIMGLTFFASYWFRTWETNRIVRQRNEAEESTQV